MVVLETQFKRLKKLVGKEFSLEELEEVLFNLGMELDSNEGDDLRIDITAERPDMVSTYGLARTLRHYFGIKNIQYKAKKSEYKVIVDKSVEGVRPYTVCAIIKNLDLDDEKIKEIIWVQEKLHATFGRNRKKSAIGIYPLEHITLPIYFRADKPENIKFRPLGSVGMMDAKQILDEHPTGIEYSHLLKGMSKYPYFIDSKNNILSMPPIINSESTGRVTEETEEIFIECSGFDINALSSTLNILVCMFIDMGADVYSMDIEYPDKKLTTPHLNNEKREIKIDFVNSLLGTKLDSKTCADMLCKMMYEVESFDEKRIKFSLSPLRVDIWHDVDVADDILRAYGVNKLIAAMPEVVTIGNTLFENRLKDKISDITIGLGFQELFTLTLTDKKDQFDNMNLKQEFHIQLGNAQEQSINMIRMWLLPEVIKALQNNRSKEYPQKVFEISHAVVPANNDVLSEDVLKFCAAICGEKADFTSIKKVLVYVLDVLGIKYGFEPMEHQSFITGRCARVVVEGKQIAIIGEVHPQVLVNFGIEFPIAAFEVDINLLYGIR